MTASHVTYATTLYLIPTLMNYTAYFQFQQSQLSLGSFSHSFIPQDFHNNHLAVSSSYGNICSEASVRSCCFQESLNLQDCRGGQEQKAQTKALVDEVQLEDEGLTHTPKEEKAFLLLQGSRWMKQDGKNLYNRS